ncbi:MULTISPECIES: ATP-binding protein [unclassified Kaistella]|uniref:sensor histidine kinase n=1 Tax=unclassified Kaistella TaxID=2762626 RepID=UPI002736096A|nr:MULTISPECIES: HAMP domain-containing sensor histidine kinase [unclassified Kaistella]MDP2454605.1 HAMP domain-containing sensor histidine kinase [Kaistella sp. SH11-4b]MDP2457342.1 HAMP domain-containing sensor histidine kinase [Kaistella sp. SH40-3]MDP2460102.1 HAMP domain-containing sensor histidine kinase [Kaistella sp. SH19-2b]
MIYKTKYRQLIHYSLIACTLCIQIIICIFIYNEYFNGKKVEVIENQIQETHVLKNLMENSRKDLLSAQDNLQKYVFNNDKKYLESYFQSLRNLNKNLDSISAYKNINPSLKSFINSRKSELSKLPNLEKSINSVYREFKKPAPEKVPFKIKDFQVKSIPKIYDTKVEYRLDSVQKKTLLNRLKAAVKNDVDVQRELTIISTKYGDSVNTDQIKNDIDSIINAVNNHYGNEIKKYESGITASQTKNNNLYQIYDQLIVYSNNWMGIYNIAVSDFSKNLEKDLYEQNSINNKIRRYSVLGLMILMFFVMIVIVYYNRQSYLYEKKLKLAYEEINKNLNFKNKILGMLSHEIRSPLKIINIFIDRISKKTKDENIADYLKTIKFTNNSLLIQANQILEYTKNQEKKVELRPIEFNLRNEIESIFRAFEPYIESKNNVFEVKNNIHPETIVLADNIKIHQVFTNILGNANKFTEDGKIEVNLNTNQVNEKIVRLNVSVSDTGAGISKSDIKKIFEPYFQGVVSTEIDNLGAGLGLNLCKEIIDLFQGTISAQSTLGKGTTVTFAINLNIAK